MMLQSVTYEQQKALFRDEKREIQFANARRLLNLKEEIIHKKDEDILQRDDVIRQNEQNLLQKDKENARLKELLRKNNIFKYSMRESGGMLFPTVTKKIIKTKKSP